MCLVLMPICDPDHWRGHNFSVDNSAALCVIKMYVNRFQDKNLLPSWKFNQEAKKSTKADEAVALPKIDPVLKGKVHSAVVNSFFHCVIMPHFHPITTKKESCGSHVHEMIKEALDHLVHGTKKMYHLDDISWRHVGLYENQVILFDLGNLAKLDKGNGIATDRQIIAHFSCMVIRRRLSEL
jgi:hypothetical protein